MRPESIRRATLGGLVLLTIPLTAGAATEKPAAPDPDKLVAQMCSYLKSLERFSFRADVTDDEVYAGGRKLQFGFSTETFVERPNRLRVNAAGDLFNKQVFLDGKTLTLYEPTEKTYASAPAVGDLETVLAKADAELRLRVPLADLASPKLCEHMGKGQGHALYVGRSQVGGVETAHLAFDRADIQYQVWISTGEKPLPMKVLINQKQLPAAPQWTAVLHDWQTAPRLNAGLFTFTPPVGVQQVRFAPPRPAASTAVPAAAAAPAPTSAPAPAKPTPTAAGDKQ